MNDEVAEILPEEREVDIADLEAAQNEQTAELEAEAPDEGEEKAATPEESDEDQPERKTRSEKRKERIAAEINALTREKYELRKQAEMQQRQLQEMQQHLQQVQPQQQLPDMPKLADFDYDESRYQQAVQTWHTNNIQQMQHQQQAAAEQQQAYAQQVREQQVLAASIAKGQEKYPDFAAKVNDPSLPSLREVSPAAFQTLMESPASADVAYYLANNPAEVYALADMSPSQAIRKMATIEASLTAAPPTATRMPPKPPSTLKGTADVSKDPSKMSTAEWMKWRNANSNRQR